MNTVSFPLETGGGHGGLLARAARIAGLPRDRILDFSTNVNPLGPPPAVLEAVRRAEADLLRYPDPEAHALPERVAALHGARPDQVVLGNGAAELIHLLPRALPVRTALVLEPTFTEYAAAVARAGGRVLRAALPSGPVGWLLPLVPRDPGDPDPDAVFVCRPNNPTGALADAHALEAFTRGGATLVVDEAFLDFVAGPPQSAWLWRGRVERLLLLASLTKTCAIPGLRLGYLLAPPDVAARVRAAQPPWSVNALALAAGGAALEAGPAHMTRTRAFLATERPRLAAALAALPGIEVHEGTANFLLFRVTAAGDTAARLQRDLLLPDGPGGGGLLVRDASNFPGAAPNWVRVCVRTAGDNDRLIDAMSRRQRTRAGQGS